MTALLRRFPSFGKILFLAALFVVQATWAAPTITTQPVQRQVVTRGGGVTLSVTAVGNGALTYQWSHGGLPIAGATASTLSLTNVQYNGTGYYLVRVTDSTGTTLSGAGFLNVLVTPARLQGFDDNSRGQLDFPTGLTDVVAIAAGDYHTLALKADGTVIGWGDNTDGEISVPAGLSSVVAIATSPGASLALKSDGTLAAWGANITLGAIRLPAGLSDVVSMSLRDRLCFIVKSDGTFVSVGGLTQVPAGLADVAAISAGDIMLALKYDGTVVTWGMPTSVPMPAGLSGVIAVASGGIQALALKSDGTVVGWGSNSSGEAIPPAGLSGVAAIVAGRSRSYAVKFDGTVVGWGATNGPPGTPFPLPAGLSGVVALASGTLYNIFGYHNVVIAQLSQAVVSTHPQSQIKNPGSSVTFNVAATGSSPLAYQWRRNGQNISNATLDTYIISSVQEINEGTYDVVVTNPLGSVTSNIATLSVNDPVVITISPQPLTVNKNQAAVFTAAASGTAPLAYQWKKNGVNIVGATSGTLTIGSAQASDAANYACEISNITGSVLSGSAALVVIEPPAILTQPISKTVNPGAPVNFNVSTAALQTTYQWRRNGADIAGAILSSYSIASASEGDEGAFDVVITNPAGKATSSLAFLAVNDPLVITLQPQSVSQMPGSGASFNVIASGTGPVTYQWRKNGVNITGAISPILAIPGAILGNAGTYSCLVTNIVGSVTSNGAELTIGPAISSQPVNRTVNPGAVASFSVTAAGSGTISYQWRKNTTPIAGAVDAAYTIGAAAKNSEGSYDVVISNVAGSVTSNPALLAVNDPIQITAQPAAVTANPAASVNFSVTAAGTGPITYQWRKNTVAISGATSASYTIASVTESAEGSYDVLVTNIAGSLTSNAAVLLVNNPVQITVQPAAKTANPGVPASFVVAATGTGPITYQWRKNTAPLNGATDASYSIASVSENDEGSYDVVVSSIVGSVTSAPASLAVNDPIQINAHPISKTANPGAPASFSVSATGTAPITYQWRKNTVAINGATGASYSIASLTENDEGSYDAVLTNIVGSLTSDAALLAVNDPIQITAHPISKTANPTALATFSVIATGTAPITYQWRKNTVAINGATGASYSIASLAENDEGSYDAVVTNIVGSLTSNAALLAVNDPIQITAHPISKTVNPAASATFSVIATGTAPITYQWRKNTVAISGATAASYSIASVSENDEGSYDVVVTNIVGSLASNAALLAVNDPIQITAHPISKTANPAASVTFSVTAAGTAPITYQWRKNTVPISGATAASYTIASLTENDEGSYDVVVTNIVGSLASNAALLAVNDPIQITAQPAAKTANPGAPISFSVTASGTGPITYQWRKNTVPISGALDAVYSIPAVLKSDEGSYDVLITNIVGSLASNAVVLAVNDPIQITAQPNSSIVNPAKPVSFSVTATGTGPLTYQWRKNTVPISGATGASYAIASVSENDEGSYEVVIANIVGNVTSAPASLGVNDPIQVTLQPVAGFVKEGGAFSFSVMAAGSAPLSYQWEHNGQPLNGATSASLTISNAVASSEGSYRCMITNVVGMALSDAVNLEVRLHPRIIEQPKSIGIRADANVAFMVTATGYAPITYQWKKDGVNLETQTGAALALNGVTSADAGLYSVAVTNEVGSVESDGAELRFVVWNEVDGTSQALLLADPSPEEPAYPGRLTATITGKGALSGKLEYRGIAYSFSGAFTPELNFQRTILRKNQGTLDLQIHLDAPGGQLVAALNESLSAGVFHTEARLVFQPAYSKQQPAAQTGRYTLRMNPALEGQAAGYAVVVIGATGTARLTGRLPDGSALNSAAFIHEDGTLAYYNALYRPVYPNAGYIAGSMGFDREGNLQAVGGMLEWNKPAGRGNFWPDGFTQMLEVEGSLYSAPLRNHRVIDFSPAGDAMEFRIGLEQEFRAVHLSLENRFLIDLPNSNQIKLSLDKSTGIVRGVIRQPGTNTMRKLEGVTLQAQREFSGFFLRDSDAIDWTLAMPQPQARFEIGF